MSVDPYAELDAAYVLGALPPAQRREYERHLDSCVDCARAVRELAGMPGILSRIPAREMLGEPEPPLPASVLPAVVAAVRRERRHRRTWVVTGAALAAAAIIAFFVVAVTGVGRGDGAGGPIPTQSFVALTENYPDRPLHAEVSLVPKKWGTELDMHCTYDAGPGQVHSYLLIAVDRSGRVEPLGSWRAGPGDVSKFVGSTSLTLDQIARVEIRSSDGRVLLTRAR